MIQTLDSFSTLLPMITRIFLLENDTGSHIMNLEKVQRAVDNHQSSFTTLQKNLREAKSEWSLTRAGEGDGDNGNIAGYSNISGKRSYEDAVDCLNRLAQHLNGLRSGTRLQYDLTKAGVRRETQRQASGVSISGEEPEVEDEQVLLSAAASMFGDLVEELGPPLRALSVGLNSSIASTGNAHRYLVGIHVNFSSIAQGLPAISRRIPESKSH